jgi:hypothetical protein
MRPAIKLRFQRVSVGNASWATTNSSPTVRCRRRAAVAERAPDVAVGRVARLHVPPREGPECGPKPPFDCRRELRFTALRRSSRLALVGPALMQGGGCVGAELPRPISSTLQATATHPQLVASASLGEGRWID